MYRNLEAELGRKGINKCELAKRLNLTPSTLSCKFNGKGTIKLSEAIEIKRILGVDMSLEELFKITP